MTRRRVHGGPSATAQLAELVEVVQLAVAIQPEADQIVRLCCAPGDVPSDIAHVAHVVTVEYAELLKRLHWLPLTAPALIGIRDVAAQCVSHHLLLINSAVNIAFPVPPRVRHTDPRGVAVGLGETGDRLRGVLDQARRLAGAPRSGR